MFSVSPGVFPIICRIEIIFTILIDENRYVLFQNQSSLYHRVQLSFVKRLIRRPIQPMAEVSFLPHA